MSRTAAPAPDDGDRAILYDFLAGLFAREPDAGLVAAWQGPEGQAFLAGLETLAPLAPLARALRVASAGALSADYAWIFHGAGGRASVTPCESVHTEGRLEGAAAGAMRGVLADLGLARAAEVREPPDHVSVELAAMAELVRRGDRARQRRFLEERLLPWLDRLHATVRGLDRHGVYTAAAAGLVAFARADHAALAAAEACPGDQMLP